MDVVFPFQALASDVSAYQTQVDNMFSLNEQLSEDPLIQDHISTMTLMKMKKIKNKWRHLSEMIQGKSERCV